MLLLELLLLVVVLLLLVLLVVVVVVRLLAQAAQQVLALPALLALPVLWVLRAPIGPVCCCPPPPDRRRVAVRLPPGAGEAWAAPEPSRLRRRRRCRPARAAPTAAAEAAAGVGPLPAPQRLQPPAQQWRRQMLWLLLLLRLPPLSPELGAHWVQAGPAAAEAGRRRAGEQAVGLCGARRTLNLALDRPPLRVQLAAEQMVAVVFAAAAAEGVDAVSAPGQGM